MSRARSILLDRGGLIGLCAFALYAALAPSFVVDGDNAELSALGALGGAAHPSGYPLYVLILRAASWLPGTPAHRAALVTAAIAAASLVVLHAACRAWGASALAAAIAVAVVGASPVVLRYSCQAEVWALNDLAVASVLWLAARGGPLRGWRRCAGLGLVAGLGLANHSTCALVAPIGLLGVVRGVREAGWRAAVAAAAGLILGSVPQLYLLAAAGSRASWGTVDGLAGLLDHVLRRDYGGPTAFAGDKPAVSAADSLRALALTLGRAWWWLPGLVGLATLGERSVRGDAIEGRWAWGALALSWLVSGPLLVLRFNIPPEKIGTYIVERFHILPAILLTVPTAVGLGWVWRSVRAPARAWRLAPAIAPAVLVVSAALSLPYLRAKHSPAMQHGVANLLGALPDRAVAIVGGDDLYFGSIYAQELLHTRADVTVVMWPLMVLPWYRDRIATRGIVVPPGGDGPPSVRLARALVAAGRPVYVDAVEANIVEQLPTVPYAGLFRVYTPGDPPPSLDDVLAMNRDAFARFDLDDGVVGPNDDYATMAHSRYGETWWRIATALQRAGRADAARDAFELARQLGPQQ